MGRRNQLTIVNQCKTESTGIEKKRYIKVVDSIRTVDEYNNNNNNNNNSIIIIIIIIILISV